jgi:glycosyltransferase involved in cell wall biosynthesis
VKHILLIELNFSGHHSVYLKNIAEGYLDTNHIVTISLLKEYRAHHVIRRLEDRYKEKIRISIIQEPKYHKFIENSIGYLGAEIAKWFIFRKEYTSVSSRNEVDYIFLPYIDYILYATGLLGSPFGNKRWGGICMLASVHYEEHVISNKNIRMRNFKKYLFFKMLKNKYLEKFFVIDELLYKFALERQSKSAKSLRYLMDPVEFKGGVNRNTSRQEMQIPENVILVLVYGVINSRKSVSLLADSLVTQDIPKNIHLLIVGEVDKTMQEFFMSQSITQLKNEKRIYIYSHFVNENFQEKVFSAADIVWLGYKEHYGMSGVLVLAAQARKVVISCNIGLINWYTNLYKLGKSIDINRKNEIIQTLLELSDPKVLKKYNNEIQNNFDKYTWKNAIFAIVN